MDKPENLLPVHPTKVVLQYKKIDPRWKLKEGMKSNKNGKYVCKSKWLLSGYINNNGNNNNMGF